MKELELRKRHRTFGIIIAVFILFQAGTGLVLSLRETIYKIKTNLNSEHIHNHTHSESTDVFAIFTSIHMGGGNFGLVFRIITAVGIIGMAVSGSMIYFKIKSRNI